ncbi:hypothetical protein Mal48_27930 [Thalassoglobus polymorphus]|uniref:Uncharacterized protein n=1 Tax=Thalassoglobus polymorphus TaxID=2527994 RepID=A0A517QPH4_9PLAN|nr:hypothetical protein Mal48_27930 [Thalassoglobus polymorphus]
MRKIVHFHEAGTRTFFKERIDPVVAGGPEPLLALLDEHERSFFIRRCDIE